MARMTKPTSYRNKAVKMSNAQKMQRALSRTRVSNKNNKLFDQSSKGVGKYAKRSDASLSKRQAYKLEKMALKNEKLGLNTKPAVIKAAGEAFAMNTTPVLSGYASSAGASKIIESANKNNSQISGLINGGVSQAGLDNEEEMMEDNTQPGGYSVR